MGDPPVEEGAVHVTWDRAFRLDVALTPVGAPGTAAGTKEFDSGEDALAPYILVAVSVTT
jgi:hypothetical protein